MQILVTKSVYCQTSIQFTAGVLVVTAIIHCRHTDKNCEYKSDKVSKNHNSGTCQVNVILQNHISSYYLLSTHSVHAESNCNY